MTNNQQENTRMQKKYVIKDKIVTLISGNIVRTITSVEMIRCYDGL